MPKQKTLYFVLFIFGDVEPELFGPFATIEEQSEEAKRIRRDEGIDEGGIFAIESAAPVCVHSYCGGFLDGEDEEIDTVTA